VSRAGRSGNLFQRRKRAFARPPRPAHCPGMKTTGCSVSIHPYFKVHAGQMDAARGLLREFVAKTATEEKVIYYEFTIHGDEIFCREAYVDADGLLKHGANVSEVLARMLSISTLTRLEIHGPAAELEKLKGAFGHLNPRWFIYECGVER
jgi:quinol monooxygenase YgiN